MQTIRYAVRVSPRVSTAPEEFRAEVARVLADPRGWRKYGYRFVEVPEGGVPPPDVLIRLETDANTRQLCSKSGLSCQREDEGDIVINEKNWLGGSQSGLPVERYHNYVITHETGHFLGLEHQRCPWAECQRRGMAVCPASVMQQMSRGAKHVAPCVESDWPLDPDWEVDDPRRAVPQADEERASRRLAPFLTLLVIILLVASAAAAVFVASAAAAVLVKVGALTQQRCW